MSLEVAEIALVCHEANRAFQYIINDPNPSAEWGMSSPETQQSVIEGVQKVLDGVSSEELHESWCEFKESNGWVYGDVKDEEKKTHPCLVEYDDLPEDQKMKDSLFHAIVFALSS